MTSRDHQDLRAHYLAYLAVLNDRRFDDLDAFVAETLTYNDRPLTRADYQDLLRADVDAIPDLHYDADLLVVEDDRVACRLWFDCTPAKEFLGLPAAGHRLHFAEHVFYRFEDDLIVEVRSMIDRDAVRRQLEPAQ